MTHKVIKKFKDADDNNTFYNAGDEYPKGSYKPNKKRIEELSTTHPKYKAVFIEEVSKPSKSESVKSSSKE